MYKKFRSLIVYEQKQNSCGHQIMVIICYNELINVLENVKLIIKSKYLNI